ncbi:MAG: hypothetical protein GY859_02005 [Desulfobacterales bacterium]|nr:hypothetical protein [Desulfobacterales bacterium]
MGWFKIENSDLVISDSVLDSTTRYLKLIFEEFDMAMTIPYVHTIVSLLEDLLYKNSPHAQQDAENNKNYTNFLTNRDSAELPDEIKKRIQKHLQENIHEIIEDYQNHLDREPMMREILAVLIVALGAFRKQLAAPVDLKPFLAKIKKSRAC